MGGWVGAGVMGIKTKPGQLGWGGAGPELGNKIKLGGTAQRSTILAGQTTRQVAGRAARRNRQ